MVTGRALLTDFALQGAVLPTLLAGAVVFGYGCWKRVSSATGNAVCTSLALAVGIIPAWVLVVGLRFPAYLGDMRLLPLILAGGLAGGTWMDAGSAGTGRLRSLEPWIGGVFVAVLMTPGFLQPWARFAWALVLAAMIALLYVAGDVLYRRRPRAALPCLLTPLLGGSLLLGLSCSQGSLAMMGGVALWIVVVVGIAARPAGVALERRALIRTIALTHPTLLLAGYFNDFSGVPASTIGLVAGAAMPAAALASLLGSRMFGGVAAVLACCATTAAGLWLANWR